jgi:hypothetical protein
MLMLNEFKSPPPPTPFDGLYFLLVAEEQTKTLVDSWIATVCTHSFKRLRNKRRKDTKNFKLETAYRENARREDP